MWCGMTGLGWAGWSRHGMAGVVQKGQRREEPGGCSLCFNRKGAGGPTSHIARSTLHDPHCTIHISHPTSYILHPTSHGPHPTFEFPVFAETRLSRADQSGTDQSLKPRIGRKGEAGEVGIRSWSMRLGLRLKATRNEWNGLTMRCYVRERFRGKNGGETEIRTSMGTGREEQPLLDGLHGSQGSTY